MVFDGLRNAAYVRALEKVIQPGATVMDLGAGPGVHGFNAARLGAGTVHLVEPSPVLDVANKVRVENGLDNVHCHQCSVEELELDARMDVIVSVFTGNFLLTEDLLPSLFYARDKFLAPGGQLIPDRARMEVVPVSVPDYYKVQIDAWSAYPEYAAEHNEPALDYGAVRAFVANTLYYDTRKNFNAAPLATPVKLMELDFATASSADCDSEVAVEIQQDGICHGWLGWFQMRLVDEWLSTSGEPETTHWSSVFLPLEQPLQVTAGEQLRFALKRPEFGEWTWTTEHAGQRQRQSTFLSAPLSRDRMLKSSENYQPALSDRGAAAQWLLTQMCGEVPVAELVTQVQNRFPTLFATRAVALKFVKGLAERYS